VRHEKRKKQNMKRKLLLIITPILFYSFQFFDCKEFSNSDLNFEIEWVEKIEGDFTFINKWSYPESVYINRFGQLSCDGICPIEIDDMKDEEGKIIKDSLEAFYEIIDTTHLFYSLKSETSSYEFGEANFVKVIGSTNGQIRISSETNISTHSSLKIVINKSKFSANIYFGSITPIGNHSFKMKKGNLQIDKSYWEKGILKAKFNLSFEDTLNPKRDLFWKGKMFKEIEKEKNTNAQQSIQRQ
jgi:hypothetical protein